MIWFKFENEVRFVTEWLVLKGRQASKAKSGVSPIRHATEVYSAKHHAWQAVITTRAIQDAHRCHIAGQGNAHASRHFGLNFRCNSAARWDEQMLARRRITSQSHIGMRSTSAIKDLALAKYEQLASSNRMCFAPHWGSLSRRGHAYQTGRALKSSVLHGALSSHILACYF